VRKPNAWYQAIVTHLSEAGEPLLVEQIWQRMEAAGFEHSSKMPRSTLGARIAELVQMKKLDRVAPKTYRIAQGRAAS
jgi:pentatricopeptide repeat protein